MRNQRVPSTTTKVPTHARTLGASPGGPSAHLGVPLFALLASLILSLTTPTPLQPPAPLPPQVAGAILGHQLTAYLAAVQADETAQAIVRYVQAVEAQEAAQRAPQTVSQPFTTQPGNSASDAWFAAISQCESGGTNGWRTGYFGIEAGYPIGGMGYAEQLAWARQILAQSGPSAWGCWATVGGPY